MEITHYEVRFHLLNGRHFRHWQIKACCGRRKVSVEYLDPSSGQIEMEDCVLVNRIGTARRVFASGRKNVSGWVRCRSFRIVSEQPVDDLEKLHYNPIKDVHWRREGDGGEFQWDDSAYASLLTQGKQVYVLEERG